MHRDEIVLKVESRLEETDLSKAEAELISKFQGDAYHPFPYPSYSIIGIVTSSTVAKIFRITYDPQSNAYCSNPLSNNSEYRIENEEHRVKFLVDIIKLCRWINQVTRPVKSFHLVPYRRTRTTNQHFVTWNGISIIKEFKHNLSAFPLMNHIYRLNLPHVEHGCMNDLDSVEIIRIGDPLTTKLRQGFTKNVAIEHIQSGIQQLHDAGFAHGDTVFP